MSALITTTDVGGSPDVPDATVTTKWKQYLWVRQVGSAAVPKVYVWNDFATSDATYLKWQEKADVSAGSIVNSQVSNSAAIAGSKLDLTNTIVNAHINSSAAIDSSKLATVPYAKLNLSGAVTNADLAGSISQDKLAGSIGIGKLSLTSSITNSHINGSAAIDSSKLATIPYAKLTLSNSITNNDVATTAAISYNKLSVSDGDIPFAKLSISNGDISNLKIDKLYEKRLAIQTSHSSSGSTLQVPDAAKQLDGIYRGVLSSSGDQSIVLPDLKKFNVKINNASGYSNGATSLTVDALPQALYAGQVVTFTNDATFTLSANASADATTITGKLVAASTVANDSLGYVYDGTSFRLSIYKGGTGGKVDIRIAGHIPSAGTYSGANLTLTLPAGHGILTSDKVTVTGMTPDYYNVVKAQVTNATDTQITYVNQSSTTPAANATGFGLVRRSEKLVNNSTGVLADSITVIPTTAANENKKIVIHCIADSNKGDGQWLIGGIPSYSSTTLQAESGETFSKSVKKDLPTSTKVFKTGSSEAESVGSGKTVTVASNHGDTAAIGDKILFQGGGILTLTGAVSASQTDLLGTVSGFGIGPNEFGHRIPRIDGALLESGREFKTATNIVMIVP